MKVGWCRWRKSGPTLAFSVLFTKRAQDEFSAIYRSVGRSVRRNLDDALVRLEEDPYPRQNPGAGQDSVIQLKGERRLWRIRCGHYRIVYRIEEADVVIIRVAHRSESYEGI